MPELWLSPQASPLVPLSVHAERCSGWRREVRRPRHPRADLRADADAATGLPWLPAARIAVVPTSKQKAAAKAAVP